MAFRLGAEEHEKVEAE